MKHRYLLFSVIVSLICMISSQSAHAVSQVASVTIARSSGGNTGCANSTYTFVAHPVNGGTTPSYSWFVNDTMVSGATTDTLVSYGLPSGQVAIYCIMTSSIGGIQGSPATSDTLPLTIYATPTVADSGGGSVCAGSAAIITLTPSGNGPFHGTFSNGSTFSGSGSIHISVSPATDTTYYVTSLSDAHCAAQAADLTDTISISVIPRPIAMISDSDTICRGGSTLIHFGFGHGSVWQFAFSDGSIIDTFTIASPTLDFPVSPLYTTRYHITSLWADGCSARSADISGTALVLVNPLPVAVIDPISAHSQCWKYNTFNFGGNRSYVPGGSISQWSWTFGSLHPDTSTLPATTIHFADSAANQTVTLWVTSNNGCTDSADIQISVRPMPHTDFTVSDTAICKGSTVNTVAIEDSNSTFKWHWGEGRDYTCQCPASSHTYTTINDKTLMLIVTNTAGCTDTASVNVEVHPTPKVLFLINDSIQCYRGNGFLFHDTSTISATQQYDDSIALYIWSYGDTSQVVNTGAYAGYVYPANKWYIYDVIDRVVTTFGCEDSALKHVKIYPTPTDTVTMVNYGDTICAGTRYQLHIGTDARTPSYRWSTNDTTMDLYRTAINTSNTSQHTTYVVTITDIGNDRCQNIDSVTITTFPVPKMPVISPDSGVSACQGSTLHFDVANIDSNVSYVWYISPAMPISGQSGPHCNVTFNDTITTGVTVVGTNIPWGCATWAYVPVRPIAATAPSVTIIEIPDATDSTLIALVIPDSNIRYQWGTDSDGLVPHYLTGAHTQDLLLNAGQSALSYWVIVTDTVSHCSTKTYFSAPVTTTSIHDLSGADIQVLVYPNPSSDIYYVKIATEHMQVWQIEVTDMQGRSVSYQQIQADTNTPCQINAASWTAGAYMLHITSASGDTKTIKLIKD